MNHRRARSHGWASPRSCDVGRRRARGHASEARDTRRAVCRRVASSPNGEHTLDGLFRAIELV